jgi:predicted ATPase
VALARELAHPFSLAFALAFAAIVHQWRGDAAATVAAAEATQALCREQGFSMYLAVGTVLRGWALGEQGRLGESIAEMESGLTAYRATGALLGQPYFFGLLARAHARTGQIARARELLDAALRAAEQTGEQMCGAETYRLLGELAAGDPPLPTPYAELSLRRAVALARRQHAMSLELRATMSLVRRQPRGGDVADLAAVHDRFTEGYDTRDLREAAALRTSRAGAY